MVLQPRGNEGGDLLAIRDDREVSGRVLARRDAAEARAGGVDEHQVRDVEQRVTVLAQFPGQGRGRRILGEDHALRAERTHMQVGRGDDRAAVEEEHDGALCRRDALAGDLVRRVRE